jgi:hypothetical protein
MTGTKRGQSPWSTMTGAGLSDPSTNPLLPRADLAAP